MSDLYITDQQGHPQRDVGSRSYKKAEDTQNSAILSLSGKCRKSCLGRWNQEVRLVRSVGEKGVLAAARGGGALGYGDMFPMMLLPAITR